MSRQKRVWSEIRKVRQTIGRVCDQRNPSKEEFGRWGGRSFKKTQSLTKSVGLVRRSGASANEWKKNPALFYFLYLLLVISSRYVTFAPKFFNWYGKIRTAFKSNIYETGYSSKKLSIGSI